MRHPDPNFRYPSLPFQDGARVAMDAKKQGKTFMRPGALVLDTHIDAISWDDAMNRLLSWAGQRQSRYVTLCNVHAVVTASQSAAHHKVLAQADLALPDGAPIAWALRREGFSRQARINGPDLTWRCLAAAERLGQSVYFYGSSDHTLAELRKQIEQSFPRLKIAGMVSPPFRALSEEEDQADVDQINQSGANLVFVGLGCPKQEAWMAAHRGRVHAVMVGVGAAFDYHAGTLRRAPAWMQRLGLEWAYRLFREPNRLLRRYAQTNSVFVFRMAKHLLGGSSDIDAPSSR